MPIKKSRSRINFGSGKSKQTRISSAVVRLQYTPSSPVVYFRITEEGDLSEIDAPPPDSIIISATYGDKRVRVPAGCSYERARKEALSEAEIDNAGAIAVVHDNKLATAYYCRLDEVTTESSVVIPIAWINDQSFFQTAAAEGRQDQLSGDYLSGFGFGEESAPIIVFNASKLDGGTLLAIERSGEINQAVAATLSAVGMSNDTPVSVQGSREFFDLLNSYAFVPYPDEGFTFGMATSRLARVSSVISVAVISAAAITTISSLTFLWQAQTELRVVNQKIASQKDAVTKFILQHPRTFSAAVSTSLEQILKRAHAVWTPGATVSVSIKDYTDTYTVKLPVIGRVGTANTPYDTPDYEYIQALSALSLDQCTRTPLIADIPSRIFSVQFQCKRGTTNPFAPPGGGKK
jgi:hypothetical protein